MATTHEDPAEAIRLLDGIQRLLRDSSYTTTYKFALLHALCDLSLELEPHENSVPLAVVAERVVELYWAQPRPFEGLITLKQATGKPATALSLVRRWSRTHKGKLTDARASDRLPTYAQQMLKVLRKDVLRRLQPSGERLLYEWPPTDASLRLLPGVAPTLRRFHGLLTDMIQLRWTAFVERVNPDVAGSDALRAHLFGVPREALRCVVEPMWELQGGRCFYSPKTRLTRDSVDVDHFLPWSLTRNNSVGNLVLCTSRTNREKSDELWSDERPRWERRNVEQAQPLAEIAMTTGLPWNPDGLRHLAEWAFSQAS